MLGLGLGLNKLRSSGLSSFLKGAMIWGFRSKYKWSQTTPDIWGFANPTDIDPEAQAVYDRIIADGGVSNLTRLNFFVKGLKAIYGDLANVPICYDAHWIGYKLGSGTGATAGQAAAKLYSLTVAGDAVQATAASQPLLLSHNGASTDNYWWGSGVSGNYVSTPSATANNITGDIEFIIDFASVPNTTTLPNLYNFLVAKGDTTTNLENYAVLLNKTDGKIYFETTDITAASTLTLNSSLTAGTVGYLKVNRIASTGVLKFFTSSDRITFTQLGTNVSTMAGNLLTTATTLSISYLNATYPSGGVKISRATISNSIGGAPVVDFNPATYNAATSQTAWTSETGEVWTISTGTATSGYKGVLVDRTIVQSDGVDDNISVAIIGNAIRTQYLAHKSLGANTGHIGGLYLVGNFAQSFYYSSNRYNFYQQGAFDGPFGAVVVGTTNRALRISGAVGGTGTDWIPFQNGVDFSNGGANIGLQTSYSNVTLFSRGNNSLFDNAIMNTYIQSSIADNLTIRTATQAFAKTLNNNI